MLQEDICEETRATVACGSFDEDKKYGTCQIIFKDCEWETDQEEDCLESHSCWNWSVYLSSLIYLFHYQLQFTMTSKTSRVFHVCISSAEHCPIFINSWKCIWEADKWLCNGCNFTCILWYGICEHVSIAKFSITFIKVWSVILCLGQGCFIFLTINSPRWDQPISDISIFFASHVKGLPKKLWEIKKNQC